LYILDANFWTAIDVLNSIGVRYWLSQGTLLGVTRDNQLIPWDRDIDFTVFSYDDSPSLRDKLRILFLEAEFKHVKDEAYNIQFTRSGGRKVDVNFCANYVIDTREYWIQQWLVPVPRLFPRKATQWLCKVPRKFDRVLRFGLTPWVEKFLYKFEYRSYKIPVELLLEFENILVDGVSVPVPVMRESICQELYGPGWRKPIRSNHWADFAVTDQSEFG